MEALGSLLVIAGSIIMIVGGVWLLVAAFQTGLLWGFGCILIPFISLVWVLTHWEEGAGPFFVSLGGFGVVLLGTLLGA